MTLVEIIVVILLSVLFCVILISDFPSIQRQFALSRAAYKLAQDLRTIEDLGLSGVTPQGQVQVAKGFGVYVNISTYPATQYIMYSDTCPTSNQDYKYTTPGASCALGDYIITTVNISQTEPGVYIQALNHVTGNWTSINFNPPNPTVTIDNLNPSYNNLEIVLSLTSDQTKTRKVVINTSGLIEVK